MKLTVSNTEDGHSRNWRTMWNLHSSTPKEKETDSKSTASYFALFRTLEGKQSWFILSCGVVLAIAAGAPLPIIGVIFAKIINGFPPTDEAVLMRVYELLGVGMASFCTLSKQNI